MTSRGEQPREPDQISTEGGVGESRRIIKGLKIPLDDIRGTDNQVIVTPDGRFVVLSTPQDIHTDADVEFDSATLGDLTALRITSSDGDKKIVSVDDLTAWIAGGLGHITVTDDGDGSVTLSVDDIFLANNIFGTVNQIVITDNLDGSVTLSTPQDIDIDADVTFGTMAIDKIIFDLVATLTPAEGELCWNTDDGTLNLGMPGGNVVLQIGQEILTPRAKAIGSDIDNGELVYVSGASGAVVQMSLAMADASSTSSGTIAMATEDIAENKQGYYTAFGLVREVNTDPATYADGDQLYLSPTNPGGFTNIKPVAPYFVIKIGIVIRAHATEGVIFVTINQRTNNFLNIRGMATNSIPYADSDGFLTETNPGLTFDGVHFHIGADNAKIYVGAGDDFSIFYDAVAAWLKTNEVTASDLKVECGSEKTVELQNVVYDDLRVPSQNTRLNASKSEPAFESLIGGLMAYKYDASNADDESVHFVAQMPHTYKEGSDIYPHIHWSPDSTDTGNVYWSFEYVITNINGTIGSTTTDEITVAADGTALKHQVESFSTIDGTGLTLSHIIICRLTRRSLSQATDTFTGNACFLEFDFHYQINTLGSRQQFIK